ncbi:hypothetical protein [Carnobacterium maltaromaticum]|uniref:hypothetical protein n=1 Tax=Carnobacterium maltaromaticum TaxID=2751 RepID=UPI001D8FAD80|nr:hypothetical protein [Carnobacterium maltaromaticum]MCC4312124.1 hypothetical protein [Carnobacterium maltaromaticum]
MENRVKMMTFVVLLALIIGCGIGLVSYTKQQAVSVSGIDKRIDKLKKENDALKLQKEQLEEEQSELINETVNSSENSSLVKEENSPNQEELKKFITDYLEVMFTYGSNAERNKAVIPFASDKYFDFINQYNSDTPIQSAYIDSKIYEISEDGSRAVVRLTYSYGIVDITPNKYEMLVSLSISKNSKGAYQIDSQENEVIQYQTQTKEG